MDTDSRVGELAVEGGRLIIRVIPQVTWGVAIPRQRLRPVRKTCDHVARPAEPVKRWLDCFNLAPSHFRAWILTLWQLL